MPYGPHTDGDRKRMLASLTASRSIQPSPYGSLFTSSGVPLSASLVALTSPDSGAYRSLTAFTDSTTPKVANWSS